jgi:hypothetical protein
MAEEVTGEGKRFICLERKRSKPDPSALEKRRNIALAPMFLPTIRHAEGCSCMRDAASCSAD